MKKFNLKSKKWTNYKNFKNLGFLIAFFIFFLFFFNLKDASATFKINRPPINNLGLVGHWTFDGGKVVNGVALDSSGNGNNANLVNIATSTFYSTGKIGQGFDFDGVDDIVSLSSVLPLITEFTVSTWVKVDDLAVNRGIFTSRNSANIGFRYRLEANGVIGLFMGNSTTVDSLTTDSGVIQSGTFYHITVTGKSAQYMKIYINGVLVKEKTTTQVLDYVPNAVGYIGSAWNTSSELMNGVIDDVRLYNRALSAGEIKNLYNQGTSKLNKTPTNVLTSGLVGHWTFDGGKVVNGVALDSSGNGNNANLVNIATSTFYSTGKIGQGFDFDGVDDIASTTRINNNEITVSAWYYKDTNKFTTNISSTVFGAWYWNADTQLQEGFDLRAGAIPAQTCGTPVGSGYLCAQFTVLTTNGTTKLSRSSLFNVGSISKNATSTQEWFHIAGTYNSTDGNQRLYVNGVLRDTDLHVAGNTVVPLTTTASACLLKMNIGFGCTNTGYFDGKIDDVRLYNRALSEMEIKTLYNMGR